MTETDLRWRLRQLPREIDPPRDLWPGIAARLPQAPRSRRWPWMTGLALAASLCLAVGLSWPRGQGAADPQTDLVQREAQALTREYQSALAQFDGAPLPEPIEPALATLDQSVAEIRLAMDSDPGARYLLDQLRRTYARRLSLTQRAVTG